MKSKKFTFGLLIFYFIALTWIIIFKLQFSLADLPYRRSVNLIPFGSSVIVNGVIDFSEIINNVLVFIPFGVFLNILWEETSLVKQMILVICTSLLLEVLQFILAVGSSDITDIITNSLGGLLGIFIAFAISRVLKKNWIRVVNTISLIGAVILTLFIAMILMANM